MRLLPIWSQMSVMSLVPTILVMTKWKLSEWTDNPGKTRETKLSVLQILLVPFRIDRDSWPLLTHMTIRALCKACLEIWQLVFLRVCCKVTNWFRSWTNTCASSSVSIHQLQSTLRLEFWTFSLFIILLRITLFLVHHVHQCFWMDQEFSFFWSKQ